jgi:hypothetical protein
MVLAIIGNRADEESPNFTVRGDLRSDFPQTKEWTSNVRIADAIRGAIAGTPFDLRVVFDPEISCFYAYTDTLEDAVELFKVIECVCAQAQPPVPTPYKFWPAGHGLDGEKRWGIGQTVYHYADAFVETDNYKFVGLIVEALNAYDNPTLTSSNG